jgi:PKD repeat protein
MKRIAFFSLLMLGASISQAQVINNEHLTCSSERHRDRIKQMVGYNAQHAAQDAAYEAEIQQIIASGTLEQRGSQTIYVIPVVFHIVHEGGPENISDAQVHDAVAILNRDYNKQNADTVNVVTAFKPIVADVGIEFRLAQKDALGNCVSGITRTYSTTTNDGDYDMVDVVNQNINGSTNTNNLRYPRGKYLNIWVCKNADGAAGYTMNPANWVPANYDGIWITHSYVGAIGTSSGVRSRALTHEVGHWLNLAHVWGNTNNPAVACGDDNVTDTPETMGWATCNLNGATCGNSIDNVQNYMEYSYCSNMFTNGQKNRMRASITSAVAQRSSLWTTTNLNNTGTNGTDILCAADFTTERNVICEGESVDFTDISFHGPSSWTWTFTGGSPASSSVQNPSGISYAVAGAYSVALVAGNGTGTVNTTKTNYVTVLPNTGDAAPWIEGFEAASTLPNADWFVYNADGTQAFQVASGIGASGTKCVKLNNGSVSGAGTIDEILSSTIDLSGLTSVTLSFKYAFAYKNSSNTDALQVWVSKDCGATWSLRKTLSGTSLPTAPNTTGNFSPTAAQWEQVDVTNIIASYLVSNFRVKFTFTGGGGNNLFIDDINISGPLGTDEIDSKYNMTLFPNPTADGATLNFTIFAPENVSMEMIDMLGQTVRVQSFGTMQTGVQSVAIPRQDLAKGVYFVRLRIGEEVLVKQLIIE